jgi:hypothetical protein
MASNFELQDIDGTTIVFDSLTGGSTISNLNRYISEVLIIRRSGIIGFKVNNAGLTFPVTGSVAWSFKKTRTLNFFGGGECYAIVNFEEF